MSFVAKLLPIATALVGLAVVSQVDAPWRMRSHFSNHVNPNLLAGLSALRKCNPTLASQVAQVSTANFLRYLEKENRIDARDTYLNASVKDLPGLLVRRNPFQLPGCLLAASTSAKQTHNPYPSTLPYCNASNPSSATQNAINWITLMPDATALGSTLASARLPNADTQRFPAIPVGELNGEALTTPLARGDDLTITLNPWLQQSAQTLLKDMTGNTPSRDLPPALRQKFAAYLEGARARELGVLVVDTETGAIEVAAHQSSPCFRQWHTRKGQGTSECPALPPQQMADPTYLRNVPLYRDWMMGSMAKIAQGLTLLEQGTRPEDITTLMLKSDTKAMIDKLLCHNPNPALAFDLTCANRNLRTLRRITTELAPERFNILQTTASENEDSSALHHTVFGTRLLRDPTAPAQSAWPELTDRESIQACYRQGHIKRWSHCQGATLINTVVELHGQGSARATPVGIAAQWLQLVTRAQAETTALKTAPLPHLLVGDEASSTPSTRPLTTVGVQSATALLNILSRGHTAGSSSSACKEAQTYATAGTTPLVCTTAPNASDLRIASKTGTTGWNPEQETLSAWTQNCTTLANKLALTPKAPLTDAHRRSLDDCRAAPVKWWAAAVGQAQGQHTQWNKVVIVFATRNWTTSGEIDAKKDKGANVATEAGLAFIQAHAELFNTRPMHIAHAPSP